MPRPKRKAKSKEIDLTLEKEIKQQILDYLRKKRYYCWMNVESKKSYPKSHPGLEDITVIVPVGKHMAIEVKRPGGKLSKVQEEHLIKLRSMNCPILEADSVEEVMRYL